ncbi:MAG: Secretion system C-terminal sorting domain [Bacteroidota bacterium]|jgi:hypothetical protein
MKQIITLMAVCFSITAVHANSTFSNPTPDYNSTAFSFFDNGKKGLSLSPNPKTGDVIVNFKSDKAGKAKVVVLNEEGATVLEQNVQLVIGKNSFNVNDFSNLAEGNYTVCLNTNAGSYSSPFLLWK